MKINNQAEYDVAKAKLYNMPLHTNDLILACMAIEKQLLEYRREHNFYEIGDLVVFVWQLESNDIFKVHDIDSGFIAVKRENDERTYYAYEEYGLIHATDAEIEAGKRGAV